MTEEAAPRPGLLARLGILLIRGYQRCISPLLPRGICRYTPSCSQYSLEAIQLHGFWKGCCKGAWRILRCAPWGGSGHDPP